jgi:hypothetical protein
MTTEKLTEEQQGALLLLNARIFVGNPCPKTWGDVVDKEAWLAVYHEHLAMAEESRPKIDVDALAKMVESIRPTIHRMTSHEVARAVIEYLGTQPAKPAEADEVKRLRTQVKALQELKGSNLQVICDWRNLAVAIASDNCMANESLRNFTHAEIAKLRGRAEKAEAWITTARRQAFVDALKFRAEGPTGNGATMWQLTTWLEEQVGIVTFDQAPSPATPDRGFPHDGGGPIHGREACAGVVTGKDGDGAMGEE